MNSNDLFFLINRKLFADNQISYVSCPITTGQRFIEWYDKQGRLYPVESKEYDLSKKQNVILPNIENAKRYISNMRKTTSKVIIDPTNLEDDSLKWTQEDYYQFWDKMINELVNEILFLDGWEYSIGCSVEYLSATKKNIKRFSQVGEVLTVEHAVEKLKISIENYKSLGLNASKLLSIYIELIEYLPKYDESIYHRLDSVTLKDDKLHLLTSITKSNVAQFISIEPKHNNEMKYIHINGYSLNNSNPLKETIIRLIDSTPSNSVNIRSFSPNIMKGNALVYNKRKEDIDEILSVVEANSKQNKFSIINENIDINDGGVSGVFLNDVIEFAPEDTPKCVDKEGVCSLPKDIGNKILKNVYGFNQDNEFPPNYRVEFSIHPNPQGVNKEHVIIWEYERYSNIKNDKRIVWPNRFSMFLGDKVFGLLIADALGFQVPKSVVISRKVAPFTFGKETGRKDKWIRTCPINKEPGKYYTGNKWADPFELMNAEEKKGNLTKNIASIISQDAVKPVFSGAAFIRYDKSQDIIEGVIGSGDLFMIGEQHVNVLPSEVIESVQNLNDEIRKYNQLIGDVSIEWVYDGAVVWIVQMNQLRQLISSSSKQRQVIVGGNPSHYEKVYVKDGLDNLRERIKTISSKNIGIELIGNIGITSHFGDLLRLANIPSKLTREV